MTILILKELLGKKKSKDDTMNDTDLKKVHHFPIYPRYSRFYRNKGFITIFIGEQGGTHWVSFLKKDKKNLASLIPLVDILMNFFSTITKTNHSS